MRGGEGDPTAPAAGANSADASSVDTNAPGLISNQSSHAPDGMTTADEKCYESRFGDIKGAKGRRHY